MSHFTNKLRSKAYFTYDNILDTIIEKTSAAFISKASSFIISNFTIENKYDFNDICESSIIMPLKIIEQHFGNKNLTRNIYTDYYGEEHFKSRVSYTEYFPNIKSFMTVYYRPTDKEDTLSIFFWGKKPKELKKFFDHLICKANSLTEDISPAQSKIIVYSIDADRTGTVSWILRGSVSVKTWDKIFIENDIYNSIVNYIESFKKAEILFNKMEVTYKLGILLYGPPGTGKTSIAKTIAETFTSSIYIVNMAYFSPEVAQSIKNIAASRNSLTVFLLEDIDYIFGKRENDRTPEEKANGNTLLQLLDGADSQSNTVFIATTNHIEALDPAIIRDGRFDLKIHMDNFSTTLAEKMVKSIGISSEEALHEIIDHSKEKHNPAGIQSRTVQYIFNHIDNLESFVDSKDGEYHDS